MSAASSSFYTLASDQSVFSRDVDQWIRGNNTESTGVQGSRGAVHQRAPLVGNEAIQASGFWYILALILPLFSCSPSNRWRCSPSTILHTAELFLTQVSRACRHLRSYIRRLATNQVSRELVATAMDVVLVVYAIGFLILSILVRAIFKQSNTKSKRHQIGDDSAVSSATRACNMAARFVVIAVCACAAVSRATQPAATIYLDVSHHENLEVRKNYTPELLQDLEKVKDDALLLYMEYTSQAAADVKAFIRNITGLTKDTINDMETRVLDRASRSCRDEFDKVVQKAQNDAHRAALFSGENHHKYLLGQMIVMRMHLNKSEDYLRRCEKVNKDCGVSCDKTPKFLRWCRLAQVEINRVKEDIIHTRKTYRDLIIHNRRKLGHLKKIARVRAGRAVTAVETCNTTESNLNTYVKYINSSLDLDKSDRLLMRRWSEEFQLQLVNITSQYRLDMTRHKEHSFVIIKANSKWNECIKLHRNEIDKAQTTYLTNEAECLKDANTNKNKKKHTVFQMEKEIRKWRKSYRYIIKQCKSENPKDDEAVDDCVIDYIQRDNYHIAFQRLMLLKLEAMSELFDQIIRSQKELEDCLKVTLTEYLDTVRTIMGYLNKCYRRVVS
ncbi:unnamed protein product [Danaus chrysippus]|uniref:(African queen) hypothetical protein n=1 Tax=Danaus chrysippus TaxID=151541 RepID=A0A8J2RFV8_9NEOP|nr:unnamed protein product [Danaus chrysippus]